MQLTMIEHSLMLNIHYDEFIDTNWRKSREVCPNISIVVDWFNNMTHWIETEIVSTTNKKLRVQKLAFFINVADYALKFRNYNLVQEITSALISTTVDRLKDTWDKLKTQEKHKFDICKNVSNPSQNYRSYRTLVQNSNVYPIVPYLGVMFSDLIAYEETPKKQGDLYNIKKLKKISNRVKDFKKSLEGRYNFKESMAFIEWIANDRYIVEDLSDRFDLSYQCEAFVKKRRTSVNTAGSTTSTEIIIEKNTPIPEIRELEIYESTPEN